MATADVHGSEERDLVAFHNAGECCLGESRCAECGYGIVSRRTLPSCPMRKGSAWEEAS